MNNLFLILANTGSSTEPASGSGSTEKITEALKNMVKSPIFYVVIGAIILLIIVIYLLRRIVKPKANHVSLVIRKGSIYKVIDEKSNKYFLVPFVDRVGAIVFLGDRELNSDKLFINNGPDALYQINYTLKFKVVDPVEFYKYGDNIQNLVISSINDNLREFADAGNALVLVKDYRENNSKILELINKAIEQYSVEALSFKVNLIQPLGRK